MRTSQSQISTVVGEMRIVERVQRYIKNQKQNHRKASLHKELISLLQAHKIEFDEKYLWR